MRELSRLMHFATPLPASPTRGEVPGGVWGTTAATTSRFTSPLVGEAGRGVAAGSIERGEL
jgi:hypothetical protein